MGPPEREFRFSSLRYIGQLLKCYLVCELGDKLVVVDMHAAHERVNYNRIRQARFARAARVQKVLIPVVVPLGEEQVVRLMEDRDLLTELGFELEPHGHSSVSVTGVPDVVSHLNCASFVRELAAEPLASGMRERFEERLDHMAARLACHASVRSGDLINRDEVYALFAQLDSAELAAACPHGRPVVAEFSREQVECWFGRDR
jgi:DNA mismatch repair protein MutL